MVKTLNRLGKSIRKLTIDAFSAYNNAIGFSTFFFFKKLIIQTNLNLEKVNSILEIMEFWSIGLFVKKKSYQTIFCIENIINFI